MHGREQRHRKPGQRGRRGLGRGFLRLFQKTGAIEELIRGNLQTLKGADHHGLGGVVFFLRDGRTQQRERNT